MLFLNKKDMSMPNTQDIKVEDPDLAELIEAQKVPVQVAPDHEAWMRAEIEKTLAEDKAGTLDEVAFEEVAQEFGYEA